MTMSDPGENLERAATRDAGEGQDRAAAGETHRGHGDDSAGGGDGGHAGGHGGGHGGGHAGGHGDGHAGGHGGHGVDHTGHETMFRRRFWVSLVLSIPVLVFSPTLQDWLGFATPDFTGDQLITPFFAVVVFLYGGLPFLRMAVPELRDRRPGMMTLISLAITVAFVYSVAAVFASGAETFFWELVTLIDIMLLGHWLEMRSVRQASGALEELAKLLPDTAVRVLDDGGVEEVAAAELAEGDLVLVRPGAAVPADGVVEDGDSELDESMLTGESRPVAKETGDRVVAGSINGDGSLRVRVAAVGEGTTLAGIMRLVEEARASRSGTQILADRAAGWLFYLALGVAVLTAIAWVAAEGFSVSVVSRVATVLVIACPHALGLAIPLVVAIATSMGAKQGVLVRDRAALEEARLLDVIVFDKTGTLTRGEFRVTEQAAEDGRRDDEVLALAAAIEGDSEHPLARGVRASAEERGLSLPAVRGFEALKGKGVRAEIEGQVYHLGGPRLLEALGVRIGPAVARLRDNADEKGRTVVYLVADGRAVAGFALADVVREESREAVKSLHGMGLRVAMLTGDSEAVARAVAEELGIDTYFAEVLPEHKDRKITELQDEGLRVAMVGDGVNDAPALERADVGIAIGSGTDVAVESAGIILVRSDPLDVVGVVRLSRATYRKMVQNLVWATGYNLVALPLAAGVLAPIGILLSPAVGAVLMSASTVIVALNAQLLRREHLRSA